MRFNPAPGWPVPPESWQPEAGWKPDPSWPSAPDGWPVWVPVGIATAVSAFAKGYNGQVSYDGDFITIHRAGFRARTSVGKGEKRIPVGSVSAVQWKPAGIVTGFIQFTMSGGNERRSAFGFQTSSAVSDENSVVFTKAQMPAFQVVRDAVEHAIAERHRTQAAPVVTASPDLADQLTKLAALRDQGILTEDEFSAQKAKLLG